MRFAGTGVIIVLAILWVFWELVNSSQNPCQQRTVMAFLGKKGLQEPATGDITQVPGRVALGWDVCSCPCWSL